MIKNKKILFISLGVIIIILAGFVLLNQQSPVSQENGGPVSQGNGGFFNIFDATIVDIDYKNPKSFVAEIDTRDIAGARENPMRKVIKLNEATEWTAYDQDKEKEWSTSFTEARKGDHILVFSAENPESINNVEEFTALKVLIFK